MQWGCRLSISVFSYIDSVHTQSNLTTTGLNNLEFSSPSPVALNPKWEQRNWKLLKHFCNSSCPQSSATLVLPRSPGLDSAHNLSSLPYPLG